MEVEEIYRKKRQPKVYISGPITSLPYCEAWMRFEIAEYKLRGAGYDAVNPMKNGLNQDDSWVDHMREDIKLLMGCDVILMLPGWRKSKGARIEHVLAKVLGFEILIYKSDKLDKWQK